MSQIAVVAQKREQAGKGVARKLRAEGLIPGVLYGPDTAPTLFSIEEKEMANLMKEHGLNMIIELELDGQKYTCMIAEYQKDVFQRYLLHIDLKRIDLNKKVVVEVPINLTGVQAVRSRGGIAQLYMRDLRVKVLPTEIPKGVDLDVSKLKPGQSLKLDSVHISDACEKIDPPTTTVVNILAPRSLALAAVDEEEGEEGEDEDAEGGEGESEGGSEE